MSLVSNEQTFTNYSLILGGVSSSPDDYKKTSYNWILKIFLPVINASPINKSPLAGIPTISTKLDLKEKYFLQYNSI